MQALLLHAIPHFAAFQKTLSTLLSWILMTYGILSIYLWLY